MEHKVTEAEHSRSYARRFFTKFCTPVFLEAFVLTFLAGWIPLTANAVSSEAFHGTFAKASRHLEHDF